MEDPTLSYWRKLRTLEPKSIRDPEQLDGSDSIAIACTQTDLKPAEQTKLVARWCELLPTLGHVKRLWLNSQVPQRLFDAICEMPGIVDLWIKWSSIKSIAPVVKMKSLRNFHLGGSAQVQSLDELAALEQLEWLTLTNTKKVTELDFVTALTNLQGFGYSSGMWGETKVSTLAPLAALRNVTWLDFQGLHVGDESLRPLESLAKLRSLALPNYYPIDEYAFIRARFPQLADDVAPYFDFKSLGIKCKKCKAEYLVMPIGKGAKNLCPACDAKALQAHCQRYDELTTKHRATATA